MGIVDYFKKRYGQKQINNQKVEIKKTEEKSISEKSVGMYDGIVVDGECLEKVNHKNIQNGKFIVPENIKTIDMFAFSNLENLKSVEMHKDIRFIAPLAFKNCVNLTEVKGLENATNMKTINGFHSCEGLERISISQSVATIGEDAFSNCINLNEINLPKNCWIIAKHAFAGCENLKNIDIPSSVELIDAEAFIGCKNLSVTFLDENNLNFESNFISTNRAEDDSLNDIQFNSEEKDLNLSDEELQALFEELNIKFRKVNIEGKDFLWKTGNIIIKNDALLGVKEVVVYNQNTMQAVIKSGYIGKIVLVNKEKQQAITIDIQSVLNRHKQMFSHAREEYYKQCLIPANGTLNWLKNCEKNNYNGFGYTESVVSEIPISLDSRIVISDLTQPKTNSEFLKENKEFCTVLSFYKKELDNDSIYAPQVYERSYNIYYPFGARFNEKVLFQIGNALSGLIDKARDLIDSKTNQEELSKIKTTQKKLIDLLLKGTNDKNVVSKIMKDVKLSDLTGKIREAKTKKDWLPYFIEPLSNELTELEEFRKTKEENERNK